MYIQRKILWAILLVVSAGRMSGGVHYVDANGTNSTPPFTTWLTAATNIQDAVDVAVAGDEVVVTNGVYGRGGKAVYGSMTNRVAVDRPIFLRSVNGPEFTFIAGQKDPAFDSNGAGAVRCVYLTNGATLWGFNLTNGATRTTGDFVKEQTAGGVFCESTNSSISNCVFVRNSGASQGGVYQGTCLSCAFLSNSTVATYTLMKNCVLSNNLSGIYRCTLDGCIISGSIYSGAGESTLNNCIYTANGGSVYNSTLNNCLVTGNNGGTWGSDLNSCTVVINSATTGGGGISGTNGIIKNCIIYYNTGPEGNYTTTGGRFYGIEMNYCCTTPLFPSGTGNITNEPIFVDLPGGNLRLQPSSPCINAGLNAYVTSSTDLDRNPRIINGTVDMGAYENQASSDLRGFHEWLAQYSLPNDGSVDFTDADGDGMNNYQEWQAGTNPTNAASSLRLQSATPNGTNVLVTWQSVIGISYFLERSSNFGYSTSFLSIATNVAGQQSTTSFIDTNAATGGVSYYRVGVP